MSKYGLSKSQKFILMGLGLAIVIIGSIWAGGVFLSGIPDDDAVPLDESTIKLVDYPNLEDVSDFIEVSVWIPKDDAVFDETEESYRYRVRPTTGFEDGSFRTIEFQKKPKISAVIGRLKGETTTTLQSLIFSKDDWEKQEALDWIEDHKDELKSKSFEEEKDEEDEKEVSESVKKALKEMAAQLETLAKQVANKQDKEEDEKEDEKQEKGKFPEGSTESELKMGTQQLNKMSQGILEALNKK